MINTLIQLIIVALLLCLAWYLLSLWLAGTALKIAGVILALIFILALLRVLGVFTGQPPL